MSRRAVDADAVLASLSPAERAELVAKWMASALVATSASASSSSHSARGLRPAAASPAPPASPPAWTNGAMAASASASASAASPRPLPSSTSFHSSSRGGGGGEVKTRPDAAPSPTPTTKVKKPFVARAVPVAVPDLAFFEKIQHSLERDYILIVDKSGSMSGSRWEEAREAVIAIAPAACKGDKDGVTLYFFSTGNPLKFENVQDGDNVIACFKETSPGGGTDLAGCLRAAFAEHVDKKDKSRGTTILVITDGEPDSQDAVVSAIVAVTKRIARDEELSCSFIQVGDDARATRFLKMLDDDLVKQGARFDIVDTLTYASMRDRGLTFNELIQLSIND